MDYFYFYAFFFISYCLRGYSLDLVPFLLKGLMGSCKTSSNFYSFTLFYISKGLLSLVPKRVIFGSVGSSAI